MQIKILNKTAFSLLEVLLAAIIFIISIAGIFVTLTAIRKPVADKENALTAAIFGKQVLEALRSTVNAGSSANYYTDSFCTGSGASTVCPDFSLALGTHQVPHGSLPTGITWPQGLIGSNTICDVNGCLVYSVSCADGSVLPTPCGADTARQVNLSINWPSAPS